MAYTPTTWATGDTITATKLNNIESGVQEVSSSYTPTTWATGDVITATKLNNIEQGIANAGGNPYEYLGIEFVTVTITGSTPPEEGDPVTEIKADCSILIDDFATDFNGVSQQPTQLVVPVLSGQGTEVNISANEYVYMCDRTNTTATGGVTVDSDGIVVTGEGTINIAWTWS